MATLQAVKGAVTSAAVCDITSVNYFEDLFSNATNIFLVNKHQQCALHNFYHFLLFLLIVSSEYTTSLFGPIKKTAIKQPLTSNLYQLLVKTCWRFHFKMSRRVLRTSYIYGCIVESAREQVQETDRKAPQTASCQLSRSVRLTRSDQFGGSVYQ